MKALLMFWDVPAIPQHIFSPYVVDFYLPSLDVIIEVEGPCHKKTRKYDEARAEYLVNTRCARQLVPVAATMLYRIANYKRSVKQKSLSDKHYKLLTKKQKAKRRAFTSKQIDIDGPMNKYTDLCELLDNHMMESRIDFCFSDLPPINAKLKVPDSLWPYAYPHSTQQRRHHATQQH